MRAEGRVARADVLAAGVLALALFACGNVRLPPAGSDGRVPIFRDNHPHTPDVMGHLTAGAERAGCSLQRNTPEAFSAACPHQGATVVVACTRRGDALTRGCQQGTDLETCRTIWDTVIAKAWP